MSAGIVHGLRLIRVLCSLSRHGALFPLQSFGAPVIVSEHTAVLVVVQL